MIGWDTLKSMIRGALTLNDAVFEDLRDDPDGFARGLKFIVTIGLIVGLVLALVQFVSGVRTSPADEISQARQAVDEQFEMMEQFGAFPDEEVLDQITEYIDAGFGIAEDVVAAVEETTPLPHAAVAFVEALGTWWSQPFGWIALWLGWGLLTLLFARLLGGEASIQQMLAVTSLVVAPHLLDAFGFVQCGGILLKAIAFIWGFVIYVKATAVANRMQSVWRALLAVLGPLIAVGIALFILIPLFVMFVAVISN